MILTFNKNVSGGSASFTAYTITVDGTDQNPDTIGGAANSRDVTLGLDTPITAGQTVTVSYSKPTSASKLMDSDGLAVESFSGVSVTNIVPTVFESATTSCGRGHDRGRLHRVRQDCGYRI